MNRSQHPLIEIRNQTTSLGEGRRGFTVFEMVISSLLLGVVVLTLVPMLKWIQLEHRLSTQERMAWQEAANTLEYFAAMQRQGSLTNEVFERRQLSEASLKVLKDGKLRVEVTPEQDQPTSRRVTIHIAWSTGMKKQSPPVQLSAWFDDSGESAP